MLAPGFTTRETAEAVETSPHRANTLLKWGVNERARGASLHFLSPVFYPLSYIPILHPLFSLLLSGLAGPSPLHNHRRTHGEPAALGAVDGQAALGQGFGGHRTAQAHGIADTLTGHFPQQIILGNGAH